jgi:hypothetical protein
LVHEIRIEALQWASTAMKDSNLRASARGNMREFERDIATTDENDSLWQLFQF